jgi:hypothetical protein
MGLIPADLRPTPIDHITRAITALAMAGPVDAERAVIKLWPRDEHTQLIVRAATSPASTSGSGWASQLTAQAVGAFLNSVAVKSAAARLFDLCPRIGLGNGFASISLPMLTTGFTPGLVSEGSPIPVQQGIFDSVTLGPTKKLAVLAAITNELRGYSAQDAEALVRAALADGAAKSLDSVVFATNNGGLLENVTGLSGATSTGLTALASDVRTLAAAIATAGAGAAIQYFGDPGTAEAAKVLSPGFNIIPTTGVSAKTLVAIDVGCIASAYAGLPEISVGEHAVLHMDTSPASFSSTGTPNVVSAPLRSLWATDSTSLKLILRLAFCKRLSGCVQYISNVNF